MHITSAVVALLIAVSQTEAAEKVDFVKDIQPILQKSCLKCHGPGEAEGGLRLHTKALALKGSLGGEVIVPGNVEESLLYEMITLPADDTERMPRESDPMTEAQTDLIRDWINQGAQWPEGLVLEPPPASSPDKSDPLNTPGLPITDAERNAVADVQQFGALAMRIAQNTNWLRVDFSLQGQEVKDSELPQLKDMPNLVELDLGGTQITDAGLVHVKGLSNLARLHLEKTKITDPGLANLKGLEKLTYLNLYGTAVGDAGLEHLKRLKNLKKLYLWQTEVTDEGAKLLQAALPEVMISRGWDVERAAESKPTAEKDEKPKIDEKAKPEKPKKDQKPEKAERPKKVADKPKKQAKAKAEDKPKQEAKPKKDGEPKKEDQPKKKDQPSKDDTPKKDKSPKSEKQPKKKKERSG